MNVLAGESTIFTETGDDEAPTNHQGNENETDNLDIPPAVLTGTASVIKSSRKRMSRPGRLHWRILGDIYRQVTPTWTNGQRRQEGHTSQCTREALITLTPEPERASAGKGNYRPSSLTDGDADLKK